MKTQRERHYVERMLSRRCYRSRYLLACEPSARSRLMARSVMNVAARGPRQSRLLGTTNPDFLISRGYTQRVILRTRSRVCTYACVIINAVAGMQGVAAREDYRFAENKIAEIFYCDLKLDSSGVLEIFFIDYFRDVSCYCIIRRG